MRRNFRHVHPVPCLLVGTTQFNQEETDRFRFEFFSDGVRWESVHFHFDVDSVLFVGQKLSAQDFDGTRGRDHTVHRR